MSRRTANMDIDNSTMSEMKQEIKRNGKIVSIYSNKGGTGKTMTTTSMGYGGMFRRGKKVVVVDFDTQVNLTSSMITPEEFTIYKRTAETVLNKEKNPAKPCTLNESWIQSFYKFEYEAWSGDEPDWIIPKVIQEDDGQLDLIYGVPFPTRFQSTTDGDMVKGDRPSYYRFITKYISVLRIKYDLIIFDLNPNLSGFNMCMMLMSDVLISPILYDTFTSLGIHALIRNFYCRLFPQMTDHNKPKLIGFIGNRVKYYSGDVVSEQKLIINELTNEFKQLQVHINRSEAGCNLPTRMRIDNTGSRSVIIGNVKLWNQYGARNLHIFSSRVRLDPDTKAKLDEAQDLIEILLDRIEF